jgi:predicted transcriptional regulator
MADEITTLRKQLRISNEINATLKEQLQRLHKQFDQLIETMKIRTQDKMSVWPMCNITKEYNKNYYSIEKIKKDYQRQKEIIYFSVFIEEKNKCIF